MHRCIIFLGLPRETQLEKSRNKTSHGHHQIAQQQQETINIILSEHHLTIAL